MRRIRRLFSYLLVLVTLMSCAGTRSAIEPPTLQRFQSYTMGTTVHITVVESDTMEAARLAQVGGEAFAFVDSLMSNWTTTSEVARINREAGSKTLSIHPEVSEVLHFATQVHAASNGAFDVTVEPLVRLWGFLDGKPKVPEAGAIEETLARIGSQYLRHDPEARTLSFGIPNLRMDLGGIAKGYGVDRAWSAMEAHG
ncbi:MAG: hypothetical protein HKN21_15130, partial [Candidatus Eisenbacteria bacterium]|nr:hypothetical protein [Candidatus Eisenbacteria bacterium]